jgi:uncharacterized membrane protein
MDTGPDVGDAGEAKLSERVASLESQVAALRSEIARLRGVSSLVETRRVAAPIVRPEVAPIAAVSALRMQPETRQSFESQLGSKVLSKVAVVMLLIGAAWFLKWAFDNRWIGATGRVAIGLVAGAAVVLWSERFRRQQLPAFSYALKAVGSGVLYLSLWASFQLYHLVPAPVAFAAMVAVTLWNALMAWSQDAQLLAAYALLGAYLTPLLLSSGSDHEVFLFSYLLATVLAVLGLLKAKPWSLLLLGVMPVTAVFFVGWYSQFFDATKAAPTMVFALLLWMAFVVVPFVSVEAEGVIANVLAPLSAGVFGALTMYSVLVDSGRRAEEPWWAVGFAAVYLALARVKAKSAASAMHLSLGIVFLTVAIPLKATGRGITVGWLVEAVVLLWVSTLDMEAKAREVVRWLGCAALLLGVGGALIEPWIVGTSGTAFMNREFGCSLGAVAALVAAVILAQRMRENDGLTGKVIAASAVVLMNLVLLLAMHREILIALLPHPATTDFCFSGWLMVQSVGNIVVGFVRRAALPRWIGLGLLTAAVIKTFAYDMRDLGAGYRVVSYLGLGVLLMVVSFAYQKDWLGLNEESRVQANEVSE